MPLIHLVGGEKGGVGKTFVSRILCQYFKDKGQEFTLVEADSQINDVGRIYHEQATSTHTLTLSDDPEYMGEPDIIFNATAETPAIVNLPSNTQSVLDTWIAQANILELARECLGGHGIVKWFVSDGCYESLRQLQTSLAAHNNGIPHVVIFNRGRLNGRNFDHVIEDPLFQTIQEAPNFIAHIEIPDLYSPIQFLMDKDELTIESARPVVKEKQGILGEQRIKTFHDTCTQAFDEALESLERAWELPDAEREEQAEAQSESDTASEAETDRKEFV